MKSDNSNKINEKINFKLAKKSLASKRKRDAIAYISCINIYFFATYIHMRILITIDIYRIAISRPIQNLNFV